MNGSKIRIAVSGAGGGVGQSIIKALQDTDYEVVSLDSEVLGTGLFATPRSYVIPYAKDPSFIDRILEICQEENCQLLFPGLDAELSVLSLSVERFKAAGIQVVVSSPEVVTLSDDKLLTYSVLKQHGIAVPYTVDMAEHARSSTPLPPYPFIIKKRLGGARSKDVHLVPDKKSFDSLASTDLDLSLFVAQEYIEGDEYTCGSVNLNGECQGVIVMRRILRDGDTYKCFSVRHEAIEAYVRKIMKAIKPFGACNTQLRLKNGQPYVFEINARCSGTTAARALCGFNEPKMIADYLCFDKKPQYAIKEQAILRYWKELVVANETIDGLKESGMIKNHANTKL